MKTSWYSANWSFLKPWSLGVRSGLIKPAYIGKNILLQNQQANFNQSSSWCKLSLHKGNNFVQIKGLVFNKGEIITKMQI
jgi:hypothetical protein